MLRTLNAIGLRPSIAIAPIHEPPFTPSLLNGILFSVLREFFKGGPIYLPIINTTNAIKRGKQMVGEGTNGTDPTGCPREGGQNPLLLYFYVTNEYE